jgi:hypothetical protein
MARLTRQEKAKQKTLDNVSANEYTYPEQDEMVELCHDCACVCFYNRASTAQDPKSLAVRRHFSNDHAGHNTTTEQNKYYAKGKLDIAEVFYPNYKKNGQKTMRELLKRG